jgi:hypothetical protein
LKTKERKRGKGRSRNIKLGRGKLRKVERKERKEEGEKWSTNVSAVESTISGCVDRYRWTLVFGQRQAALSRRDSGPHGLSTWTQLRADLPVEFAS